jgi:hypothetical protein
MLFLRSSANLNAGGAQPTCGPQRQFASQYRRWCGGGRPCSLSNCHVLDEPPRICFLGAIPNRERDASTMAFQRLTRGQGVLADCHDRPSSGDGIRGTWAQCDEQSFHHKLNAPSNHVNAASNAGLGSSKSLPLVRYALLHGGFLYPRRLHALQTSWSNRGGIHDRQSVSSGTHQAVSDTYLPEW